MYNKVYIEIINTCNGTCSFCHGTKRAPARLSLDRFKRVIDSLNGVTEYVYLHVMGEPLTHPDVTEMIAYASSSGFKCAITTNGLLLSEMTDAIISSGIYKVSISLHSFEGTEDGSFAKYIDSCAEFASRASNAGILTVLRLWNRGYDEGRNDIVLARLKDKLHGEWKHGGRGVRIKDKLHLEYGERFEWPDIGLDEGSADVFCYGLKDQFGILSDGTVIPCCLDADGEIALGNIFETDINEILSSERAVNIRTGFMKRRATEPLCRRCPYARRFK